MPDKNFTYLAETWKPPSLIPAALKVTDIAGLIRGASEGAGLGNAFLSHIAAVDGIYHLVRAFDSDEVVHVDDSVDPIRDLETIQGELCAKDRATLESVMENEMNRVRKEKGLSRSSTNFKLSDAFQEAYDKSKALLESNTPIQTGEFSAAEVDVIKDWGMITTKPQIYVVNLSQKNFIRKGSKWLPKINEWVRSHGGEMRLGLAVCSDTFIPLTKRVEPSLQFLYCSSSFLGGQIIPVSCEFEQRLFDMKDDKEGQKGKSTGSRGCEVGELTMAFGLINIV